VCSCAGYKWITHRHIQTHVLHTSEPMGTINPGALEAYNVVLSPDSRFISIASMQVCVCVCAKHIVLFSLLIRVLLPSCMCV